MTLSALSTFTHAPEPPAMPQKKRDKLYFWKNMSVDSIPPVIAMLDSAKALMQSSNLQLLNQGTMTKETFVSALCIWAHQFIQAHGVGEMEKLLREPFKLLNELVAEDQRKREADKLAEQQRNAAPEGFSKPRKAIPKPRDRADKKSRRRSS